MQQEIVVARFHIRSHTRSITARSLASIGDENARSRSRLPQERKGAHMTWPLKHIARQDWTHALAMAANIALAGGAICILLFAM